MDNRKAKCWFQLGSVSQLPGERLTAVSPVGGVPRGGLVDRKQRPDIGAAAPASLTGELRFEIRQPDMIGPAIGVDDDRMRAV